MKKRVLKKKVKIGLIAFIILAIIIFISIKTIIYHNSDLYKLKKHGYNKETANEIIKLDKSSLVLSIDYDEAIPNIIKSKYFLDKNLTSYLKYYNDHKNLNMDDIISIINVHADSEFYSLGLETNTDLGIEMLTNKYYTLKEYEPDNLVDVKNWYAYGKQKLVKETYEAFIKMFNAAKKEDLTLIINDAYRSYNDQAKTYNKYDDNYAAKPGYSEHQTGLAIDIISPDSDGDTFDTTDEFRWLKENSYKYGFILRYPKGKKNITGYEYESWHYRYLGIDLATKVHESGLTYDEYYAYYIDK